MSEMHRREQAALEAMRAKKNKTVETSPKSSPVLTPNEISENPEALLKQLIAARAVLADENLHVDSQLASLKVQLAAKRAALATETARHKKLSAQSERASQAVRTVPPALAELTTKLAESREALTAGDLVGLEAKAREREAKMQGELARARQKLTAELETAQEEKGDKAQLAANARENDRLAEEIRREVAFIHSEVPCPDPRVAKLQGLFRQVAASKEEVKGLLAFCNESVEARTRAEEAARQELVEVLEPARAKEMLATLAL